MLRLGAAILSPLRTRFDENKALSPRPSSTPIYSSLGADYVDIEPPEDYARDARIEVMRRATESLKETGPGDEQLQLLNDIHRIMSEDSDTKDVFREMDGFLAIMNILSSQRPPELDAQSAAIPDVKSLGDNHVVRLVFAILSQAIKGHPRNRKSFETLVGYQLLHRSLETLIHSHLLTLPQVLGYLFAFAMQDFGLCDLFLSFDHSPALDPTTIDAKIATMESRIFFALHNPAAIVCMFRLLSLASPSISHATLRIIERIVFASHRNQALLNQIGLAGILFEYLHSGPELPPSELPIVRKTFRRILEMGASIQHSRSMFQSALKLTPPSTFSINSSVLEYTKFGMRAIGKWPDFISIGCGGPEKVGIELSNAQLLGRTFPGSAGFTYMAWVYIEKLPLTSTTHIQLLNAFGTLPPRILCSLSILPSGYLSYYTTSMREPIIFDPLPPVSPQSGKAPATYTIPIRKWVHITLVHHATRSSSNIRVFLDGALYATHSSPYPKTSPPPVTFFVGNEPAPISPTSHRTHARQSTLSPLSVLGGQDSSAASSPRGHSPAGPVWFLASTHLLLQSIPIELPRLVYTLGPRYAGNFQDALGRFLTYKSSTSLNIAISRMQSVDSATTLTRAMRNGISVKESLVAFAFSPAGEKEGDGAVVLLNAAREGKAREEASVIGDVQVMKFCSLDDAVWTFGGAVVLLRLVELATTESNLVNALSAFADAVNASWKNSEEMERIHGYSSLMSILRNKISIFSLDVFHVLLEFLGLDFGDPENSTIINPIAYQTVALDFSFWSLLPFPIQRLHLSHFQTILQTSRFRTFNAKYRFVKFAAVKKMLYVLQTHMYRDEMVPEVIGALACIARQNFSTEATIKPIVSYLAANLEPGDGFSARSAISAVSQVTAMEKPECQERAEQVLEAFVTILSSDVHMAKFRSAFPAARICLLLLGTHPSPVVASHVLNLVGMMLAKEPSFVRKFEIVSFWSVLKDVLPGAWDPSVHVAIFDVLLGRSSVNANPTLSSTPVVVCPQVFPAILASLDHGLRVMIGVDYANGLLSPHADPSVSLSSAAESSTEVLAEELIELHSASPSFRSLFQGKPTVAAFIKTCKSFIVRVAEGDHLRARTIRISEKLTHLVLMLALDTGVDPVQKDELMEIMRISQHEPLTVIPLTDQPTPPPSRPMSIAGSLRLDILGAVDATRSTSKAVDRTSSWRQLIVNAEKKRLRKAHQDQREYVRQLRRPEEWHDMLHAEEYGLWPVLAELKLWRLDETEGPMRVRKKLQPELSKFYVGSDMRTHGSREISNASAGVDGDAQSVSQPDAPPWEEGYEYGSTNLDDDARWGEDSSEDKNRRVRHELEPHDVIEDVRTVTRIVGVDASPGLLIVGRTHIYMLDGLVQGEEDEIIDARDAPKDILSVPGTMLDVDGRQRAQRWAIEQVSAFSKRTYLFRDVGLEIYFKDSRSILIVFSTRKDRQTIMAKLHIIKMQPLNDLTPVQGGSMRTPLLSRVGARLSVAFQNTDEILSAQRKWQAREISNFSYLCLINQASGRTLNDLTQYPVFPWILKDYVSEELDLANPEIYRDLTKPIGALTTAKREAAELRYVNLLQVEETPFHYGTHFSSSMIVSHFLIRLSPFSHYFKVLQGGDWDLPDRLFTSIKRAWDSASLDSRGDVRELIPEFFMCPEFLLNLSKLDFGTLTASSQKIDSVELPPWAKKDPYLFIDLHRKALESDYVSENLPAWIDLIWGCKQRDQDSINIFHPLSYEGAIDLDSISDPLEKEATAGIIHNFGQTPRKIFFTPHPPRYMDGSTTLPLGVSHGIPEDSHLLLQSSNPVRTIGRRVAYLSVDPWTERPVASRDLMRSWPQSGSEHVEWGFPDKSLRLFVDGKS
ncbi:hypothetical protein FRB99_002978 [Tulasnella sp. 403]|nr:hypothetical protein FRB99_002978 [Tulasnella sp. 403]